MDSNSNRVLHNISDLRGIRDLYKRGEVSHSFAHNMETYGVASHLGYVYLETDEGAVVSIPFVGDNPPQLWGVRTGNLLSFIAGVIVSFVVQLGLTIWLLP